MREAETGRASPMGYRGVNCTEGRGGVGCRTANKTGHQWLGRLVCFSLPAGSPCCSTLGLVECRKRVGRPVPGVGRRVVRSGAPAVFRVAGLDLRVVFPCVCSAVAVTPDRGMR